MNNNKEAMEEKKANIGFDDVELSVEEFVDYVRLNEFIDYVRSINGEHKPCSICRSIIRKDDNFCSICGSPNYK